MRKHVLQGLQQDFPVGSRWRMPDQTIATVSGYGDYVMHNQPRGPQFTAECVIFDNEKHGIVKYPVNALFLCSPKLQ